MNVLADRLAKSPEESKPYKYSTPSSTQENSRLAYGRSKGVGQRAQQAPKSEILRTSCD